MQTRTVQVGHLSDLATEREIHEFFTFSGDIEHIEMYSEPGQSKTAYVTFKDPKALEIALLLSKQIKPERSSSMDPKAAAALLPDFKPERSSSIDPKAGAALQPDFEPFCEWERAAECETFIIHLPEFRKENLKIVLKKSELLEISGERQAPERRRSRFQREIKVSEHCKKDEIKAELRGGYLYIKMPKKVSSSTTKKDHKTMPEAPRGPAIPPALPDQIKVQTEEKPKADAVKQISGKCPCQESVVAGTNTAVASGALTVTVSRRVLVLAAGVPAAAAVGSVLGAFVAFVIYGPSWCSGWIC